MKLAGITTRSRWGTLLWKDYRQVKGATITISLSFLLIQAFVVVWGFSQEKREQSFWLQSVFLWTLIGPFLMATFGSGMLVGHERQMNTWNWQSSLPISWLESLVSKLLVTLLASIATAICLSIIPFTLIVAGPLTFDATQIEDIRVTVAPIEAIAFFQALTLCFLVCLLMREPLNAVALAGLLLTVGQAILNYFVFDLANADPDSRLPAALAVSIVVLALSGTFFAYRWRWRSGQLAELSLRKLFSSQIAPSTVRFQYGPADAPSQWNMLLRLGLRNSLGLRLIALLGTVVIFAAFAGTFFAPLISVSTFTGVFLCGLSTFEGDRTLDRFRFLADRGIAPSRLVTHRLIVSIGLVFVLLTLSLPFVASSPKGSASSQNEVWNILAMLSVAFSVPALLSMAFPKPIMSAGIALALCIGTLVLSNVYLDHLKTLGELQLVPLIFRNPIYWAPFQSAALMATIYWLARRWIVLEDYRVPIIAVAAAVIVLFSPGAVCLILFRAG